MTNETNNEPNVLLYENATGPVPYGLKNDYMFHVVFQENMHALKGLISSVLHIPKNPLPKFRFKIPLNPEKVLMTKPSSLI